MREPVDLVHAEVPMLAEALAIVLFLATVAIYAALFSGA
jgi:hypothetical protein